MRIEATCIAIAAGLMIGGCQATPATQLEPSTFLFPSSRTQTKEAIIGTFLEHGYQINRDSEYLLAMDRPADSFGARFLYGSNFNGTPNARVTMTFLGDKPTEVHTAIAIVTNPGSGFEQISDISGNADARASIARGMALALTRSENSKK